MNDAPNRVLAGIEASLDADEPDGPDLAVLARWLYEAWLPVSGEALRDFPLFVERVRCFPDVPEREAVIDLVLPLS
ncbi:MAG TPA: hypothetical protein VLC08_02845 [Chitinolyticbacter sp.]|nr:hypothetical protein [Chitinolyticbacter sp.]